MLLKIIPTTLLAAYVARFAPGAKPDFELLHDSELSTGNFSFYTSVSAVFSSKIEGEPIELDSFIKHRRFGIEYLPDYTRKIDDLLEAYSFAQQNKLSEESLMQAHAQLTRHILPEKQQGKIRAGNMFVITKDGRIEYVAAAPGKIALDMSRLYQDMTWLLQADLSFEETFFYAAMLHLVFVKIHPFDDGNGRTARLLEKWFLAEKLGAKAWFIQSERNYYDHHQTYYTHIRALGLEYEELDYGKALPFLQMLPDAISLQRKDTN